MGHVASVRLQPVEWIEVNGEWRMTRWEPDTPWEVICAECGDGVGPFEHQNEQVRRVRGPYRTPAEAIAAMRAHIGVDGP